MVRYADDFVMGFERLEDVNKVQRGNREAVCPFRAEDQY
jgi:hypothetical protein